MASFMFNHYLSPRNYKQWPTQRQASPKTGLNPDAIAQHLSFW